MSILDSKNRPALKGGGDEEPTRTNRSRAKHAPPVRAPLMYISFPPLSIPLRPTYICSQYWDCSTSKMRYTPFASDIELPFYTALASHKINHDKLDDSARPVLGLYEIRSTDPANASCRMQIHGNALASNEYDQLWE